MEEVKKYLLDIGFDDAHLPELFNDDDKSTYTIPELMQVYTDHKLKLLGIANVSKQRELFYNFITWYNAKPKVEKNKDGLVTTGVIDDFLKL